MDDKKDNQVDFVSYIAHELRAPLASMRWYAEMLLDGVAGQLTDEQKKIVSEIYSGDKRLVQFINNLLESVHVDNGKYKIGKEDADIVLLTKNIIEKSKDIVGKKKLRLNIKSPEKYIVNMDKKSAEFIIGALIANAINYSNNDNEIDISITPPSKEYNSLVFLVKDNGVGITEDDQKKIFTEMFRGNNTKDKNKEGTGTSLFVSNKISNLNKWSLSFESKENAGATFALEIHL